MNYELAKQLRDSGFPSGKENEDYYEEFRDWIEPSLSELIAACGDKFWRLEKIMDGFWNAEDAHINQTIESGKTPEEAVAKLWLALNKSNGQNNQSNL